MHINHEITTPSAARRAQAAMSLIELMVTVAIASIVFAAVASLSMFTSRSMVAMGNYGDLNRASQDALDRMSREIRQTKDLTYYAQNLLVFTDHDNQPLYYYYVPSVTTLYRYKNGTWEVLLQDCDYLNFSISQRNPSNNFTFYPVQPNRPDLAKLVDVNWRCSRQILGKKVNTESVQTAKIVLRN